MSEHHQRIATPQPSGMAAATGLVVAVFALGVIIGVAIVWGLR
jgi:hypothetical protein